MSLADYAVHDLPAPDGTLRVLSAGDGPPVLLLHGYPQSGLMWHAVAPRLVDAGYRVLLADLPGYGASTPPTPAPDHVPHAKRTWARTLVGAMAALGHARFAVVGHDRGGRVAYRMVLDHPDAVARLAVLDIVPTLEVWERADDRFAALYWHWGFLAQAAPLPESLILGAPDATWEHHVRRMGIGGRPGRYPDEVLASYRAALSDPARVEAMCEDYRAGLDRDREHDEADRDAGRAIACPTLALWGTEGAIEALYGDPLAVWRPWAPDVRGRGVAASHFLAEDAPAEVAEELRAFLGEGPDRW